MPANLMENVTKLLRTWCSTLPKADILCFRAYSALERGELKSKGKGINSIHFNGSVEPLNWFVEHIFPSIRSMCSEQWRILRRIGQTLTNFGEIRREWEFGIKGFATEFPNANAFFSNSCRSTRKLCVNTSRNLQNFLNNRKLTKLWSNAGFSKNIEKGHFVVTIDDAFVLIHQDNKSFISELFKVIPYAISLIFHYRTMY